MAKHFKSKKTLFFIAGSSATEAEIKSALEYEPGVQFRNAALTRPDESIEAFDRVAGLVPARYQAVADAREGKTPAAAPTPPLADPGQPQADGEPRPAVTPPAPNPGAGWSRNA